MTTWGKASKGSDEAFPALPSSSSKRPSAPVLSFSSSRVPVNMENTLFVLGASAPAPAASKSSSSAWTGGAPSSSSSSPWDDDDDDTFDSGFGAQGSQADKKKKKKKEKKAVLLRYG